MIEDNQKNQHQTDKNRPTFMQPNDYNPNGNLTEIMSSIHNQEQQIMKILNKYKDVIPQENISKNNKYDQEVAHNGKLKNKKKYLRNTKQIKNQSRISTHINKTISDPVQDVLPPHNHRTLSLNNDRVQKQLIKREKGFQIDNLANINSIKNQVKLPKMITKRQSHKKQQHEIQYEKIDKQYQQKMAKFYQGVNNKNQNSYGIRGNSKTERVNQNVSRAISNNKHKDSITLSINLEKYPSGLSRKQENIFDDQQYRMAQNTERIAKPLFYYPYQNKQTERQSQQKSNNNKIQSRISSVIDYDDATDQPTAVPMSYYIRQYNNKLKQQSKQQINYLYFSKADQNGSNKEWAQQIINMFNKHDQQIEKMHKNMMYLESFDEIFFTSGIYQNKQASNNKKQY